MKISLDVPETNLITNHGYGAATERIYTTLVEQGHEVKLHNPDAPVEISFTQPYNWKWSNPDAYHVGYVPWESTRLPDGWLEIMSKADEIWATSPWVKRVFEKNGLNDVKVFLHGVDTLGDQGWKRKRRRPDNRPIRFLHMGEPAPRKGGQMVYDTFRDLFGDSDEVQLTVKAWHQSTVRGAHSDNVKLITAELEPFELIDLVRRHDVLVYPSYGEGFGLIPLQAMATGMPVICTEAWAPYRDYLIPELRLRSRLITSPWKEMHPGNVYEPSEADLRAALMVCADPDEYKNLSLRAYGRSFDVERDFDWHDLTRSAFAHLVEKFGNE